MSILTTIFLSKPSYYFFQYKTHFNGYFEVIKSVKKDNLVTLMLVKNRT